MFDIFRQVSIFDYVICAALLVALFRAKIAEWFSQLMIGSEDRHELHSEVHGILLAVTQQAAAAVQTRDIAALIMKDLNERSASYAHEMMNANESLSAILELMKSPDVAVSGIQSRAFQVSLLKAQEDQLDATKKLDDRMFEFVNSTKRIMRAMEGSAGDDDDQVIEMAKEIRMRAADKGVDLTLEDAIKRARNQATFR